MPIFQAPGNAGKYFLVCFDKDGVEEHEADGSDLGDRVLRELAAAPVPSDVFILSHGWMGDVPAAKDQYDRWIAAFAGVTGDAAAAIQRDPNFRPLIVGLHWPSLPWGDETLPASQAGLLDADDDMDVEYEVKVWSDRISETPRAQAALHVILSAATGSAEDALSPEVRAAYQLLFAESGLEVGDARGRPGADQASFDIDKIIADSPRFAGSSPSGVPGVLGGSSVWDNARNLVLAPLRALSFWKMKDRARTIGENAGRALLTRMQAASSGARFHLMGHSFGCIVVSATVFGGAKAASLPRPVDSLFLVQGALSLWAFAKSIPYGDQPGYFRDVIDRGLVRGPIVTTQSRFDTAVGRYYPIGARTASQYLLSEEYPQYGGIGTYGIQGSSKTSAEAIGEVTALYDFSAGDIYNIDCSRIIAQGSGTSGAHSDIAHPEVAHILWSAVLSTFGSPPLAPAPPPPPPPAMLNPLGGDHMTFMGVLGELLLSDDPPQRVERDRNSRALPMGAGPDGGSGRGVSAPAPRAATAPAPAPVPAKAAAAAAAPAVDGASSGTAVEPRYVTAKIDDRSPTQALLPEHWYTLSFGIDIEVKPDVIGASEFSEIPFDEGVDSVLVTIQLDSADFTIGVKTMPLRIPRSGASEARARFGISPVKNGPGVIKATIHKDGNFIQELQLTFDVGATKPAVVITESRGRPIAAADRLRPRSVSLIIEPRDAYYDCRIVGVVGTRARLTITPDYLAEEIKIARASLLSVVQLKTVSGPPFQMGIKIGTQENRQALEILAVAGERLYRQLFFTPDAGVDSISLGQFLRNWFLESAEVLDLQVSAEKLPVPWGLLYLGPVNNLEALDWDKFLGFRHIVEQMPLQNLDPARDPVITSSPVLHFGTQLNFHIDQQFQTTLVKDQAAFWNDPRMAELGIIVSQRDTAESVSDAVCDSQSSDQILYFYCHAVSYDLGEKRDPGSSKLTFTDGELTLNALQERAPVTQRLNGRPLVFINACESAELSPLFYDGFVPYFVARGARGVMGTECSMPALFAAHWSLEFFKLFMNGMPLGQTVLSLRQRYLKDQGNPMGLFYAVYCDPNTQVKPAVQI